MFIYIEIDGKDLLFRLKLDAFRLALNLLYNLEDIQTSPHPHLFMCYVFYTTFFILTYTFFYY